MPLTELLSWLEPRAVLLALTLPPVIRLVGHLIPEELFMVALGVLAVRSGSPVEAVVLLAAVGCSHLVTDQVVYLGGRWLRPRLERFPRIAARLTVVTRRLEDSPAALLGLIPARVLPLGRGAWLAGAGVVATPWPRFLLVDLLALVCHVAVWCGLGLWLAEDLGRLLLSAEVGREVGWWVAVVVVSVVGGVLVWRWRSMLQPSIERATRGLRSLRTR